MNTAVRRMPAVPEGAIIDLPAGDRVWYKDAPLRMQVTQVRLDLVSKDDPAYNRVWLEGFQLDDHNQPVQRWQELVDTDVLARVTPHGSGDRPEARRSGPTLD
ncbi:hypothetical protein [Rugosimonospora africana]|uniref:Uncharacterized protein n=1 Tax=Rugosimonospora africana TaxID=556532 RepID=A0A8J3R131_9ACTN|nr:hypothetical protein [Rugosimonospora africana]GIH19682.1 hypothetical protein Raf01_78540 [Rugosimonospora africana]